MSSSNSSRVGGCQITGGDGGGADATLSGGDELIGEERCTPSVGKVSGGELTYTAV
jgi:hypothetical protein